MKLPGTFSGTFGTITRNFWGMFGNNIDSCLDHYQTILRNNITSFKPNFPRQHREC